MCKDCSIFMGFTTRVHSLNNVVLWYKQLKYRFLDSAHILCAYRLMDPDIAHMQDCMDDGELGSGRRLLQLLIDGSHENVTVYVVRYHKGRNISSISFPCVPVSQFSLFSSVQLIRGHSYKLGIASRVTTN